MDKGHPNEKKQIIEQIKNQLSLENLLQIYNIKAGETKNTYHCPFHDDKNPSFSIKDNLWHCFTGCGSGDQISFIQKIDNLSFEEALIKASNICNIAFEKKKGKILLEELQEKHLNYLANRGIKKETAKLFGLKTKGDYILFPQKREDKIAGYKAINFISKEMFIEGQDKKSKLFPNYECQDIEFLIFTAGEYDCMYLTQKLLESNLNDYKVVTSSTGEGSFPKDLNRLKDFNSIEKFMIFYDHDDAGKKGAFNLAKELSNKLEKIVEIYSFPKEKKLKYDVSDFFNEGHSLEELFKLEKITYTPDKKEKSDQEFNLKSYFLDSLDKFDFVAPSGYRVDEDGIFKITINSKEEETIENISGLPVLITEQAIDTDENVVNLILAFKRDGLWQMEKVQREVICDGKRILELCNSGFPVNSVNSRKIVEYLYHFELANIPVMKKKYLTHNNGWKKISNSNAFGLGSNILGIDKKETNISFSPDQGFERFAKGLKASGNYNEWVKSIEPLMKNPKVAFVIYASLSAPLLSLFDCPSFLVHFWGDSSMGKTTVMEIAASVWGNPAKENSGIITSWNNTMVFVERMASFFNDLPMYLDDSQTADDKTVSKIMYMIGNSTGKGRGKKAGGIDSNKSWHTICFSTGEKQLTESTQYDGAKARTIEFNGSPFGRNEGKVVNKIKSCVRENYGFLGSQFMEKLLQDLEDPEKLEEYKEAHKVFRELLSMKTSNEIGDRMANYFAIIQLAGTLAERYFGLSGDVEKTIEDCFLEAIEERKAEGDTSTRALNEVISFATGNIKSFMGKSDEFVREHFGIWKDNEYIAFHPHKLKEFLTKAGFSYNSILRSWGDREWIKRNKYNFAYPVNYGNVQYRLVVIKWQVAFK